MSAVWPGREPFLKIEPLYTLFYIKHSKVKDKFLIKTPKQLQSFFFFSGENHLFLYK